eukprot:3140561-Lingulodinium_polyedra.AAC.1
MVWQYYFAEVPEDRMQALQDRAKPLLSGARGRYAYVLVYVDDGMVMGSDPDTLFDLVALRVLRKRTGTLKPGVSTISGTPFEA